jgi:hypothetical protein
VTFTEALPVTAPLVAVTVPLALVAGAVNNPPELMVPLVTVLAQVKVGWVVMVACGTVPMCAIVKHGHGDGAAVAGGDSHRDLIQIDPSGICRDCGSVEQEAHLQSADQFRAGQVVVILRHRVGGAGGGAGFAQAGDKTAAGAGGVKLQRPTLRGSQ